MIENKKIEITINKDTSFYPCPCKHNQNYLQGKWFKLDRRSVSNCVIRENPGTGDDSSDDNNGGNTDAPDNGSTGDENPGTGGEAAVLIKA